MKMCVTFAADAASNIAGCNRLQTSMNNKLRKGIERGQCSFYRNVRVRENVVMDISEFVTQIRCGKWKNETERYKQLRREGRKEEAARVKANLPAILVAGRCEGGHTKANFLSFSGFLMVDVDHYEGDLRVLLHKLEQQPWTLAGWVSVSGEGLKVVVKVMAETQTEYELGAYPAVAARVGELLGVDVDMQCKDLTRMCYASWDADAFLKEDCEVFPWERNAETPLSPVAESIQVGEVQAEGMVGHFFRRFCERHSFVAGKRHQFLLDLGRSARRNGMNLKELSLLTELAESNLTEPGYENGEITRNILDSYRLTENRPGSFSDDFRFRAQNVPSTPPGGTHSAAVSEQNEITEEELEEEERKERNRKLRYDAPYLPDWIFDCLPKMLTDGLQVAKNKRQRDMLLLSMLVNLSACMPNVKLRYDDEEIYPHLFLTVVASSASGKGIMAQAAKLARLIQSELEEENVRRMKEYANELLAWNRKHEQAVKGKSQEEVEAQPEPPLRETLIVPADVSRSQLIRLMAGSPNGVLLNTSELDTLKAAVNAEYGRFDDLMRSCFHHEMFGSDFKSDKRAYIVYVPKMAFCGSGTPNQFYRLCPSIENGAYSRYLIYLAEQDVDFLSMAPRGDSADKNKLFKKLSEETLRMYRYLKAYPTDITLTSEQWDFHRSFYQGLLQSVKMEEVDGPLSVIFRYGMITARIAMIFTALRKYEAEWSFRDISCSDDDFMLAMSIMEVLVSHSLLFATSLKKVKASPARMRQYFKVRKALEKLGTEFTYSELIAALNSMGCSEATAKRYRTRLMELNIIEKQGDKYCFASREWRRKLDKTPLGKV